MPSLKYLLERRGACVAGRIWAECKTARHAWETCLRGDWLLWACEIQHVSRRLRVSATIEILSTVLHLEVDDLPARTVTLLSQWYAETPESPELYEAVCDLRNELERAASAERPVIRAAWYAEAGCELAAYYAAVAQADSTYGNASIAGWCDVYNAALSMYADIVRKHITFADLGDLE